MNMKQLFRHIGELYVFIVMAANAQTVQAATGHVKGVVEYIRTHDAERYPQWAPPRFWFTLKAVTQAGNCPRFGNGNVLFVVNNRESLAHLLAAQAAGQEVAVGFDDARRTLDWCAADYITSGNPPPLY